MSESKIPRDQKPLNPEAFLAQDAALGKSFPIRECTDEQLSRYSIDAQTQAKQFMQQAMQFMGMSTNCSKAAACIDYEIDRRKRSVAIVTDLGQIHGLRKQ